MKVVITPNPYRDKQFKCALAAQNMLASCGVETAMCLPFGVDRNYDIPKDVAFQPLEEELASCDVLLCLGGDGTMLHSSKVAAKYGIPLLGINIGTMGFMAELEAGELNLLKRLAEGNYRLEKRMMLSVSVQTGGKTVLEDYALNDAVVTKGAVARVLQIEVACDGASAMSFSGDGVIICTPTGSTAYSLSAGGPIVEPTTQNMVITPICAHGQNANCVVTDSNRTITVSVSKIGRRNAFLSIDGGRAFRLESGDRVTIRRSEKVTRLVRLKDRDFFDTIDQKFYKR